MSVTVSDLRTTWNEADVTTGWTDTAGGAMTIYTADPAMGVGDTRPATYEAWIELPDCTIMHGDGGGRLRAPTRRAPDMFPMVGVGSFAEPATAADSPPLAAAPAPGAGPSLWPIALVLIGLLVLGPLAAV